MPDDLAGLADEIKKELSMYDDMEESKPSCDVAVPLPEARTIPKVDSLEQLARSWVKWLPVSIIFCGLAFAGWMIIQVIAVARYHDGLGRVEQRVKTLEEELAKAKAGESVEYWTHQCETMWRQGAFDSLKR